MYLESVFNNTGNGLLTLDPDGRIVRANDEFANMFNLKKELIESQPAESVGEGVLRPLLVAVYEHYDSNPQYVKYNGGRVFKASATQFQLPDETDPHVLLSVSDVSRLFQLEHETGDVNHAGFVGNSPAMQQVYRTINQLKHSESTVLILGESGVGKELVARAIHRSSVRGERSFIAVNCGAIDKHLQKSEMFGYVKGAFTGAVKNYTGYFEQADGGTLFLDELGDLAEDVQSLLLRVLEYGDYQRIGEEKVRTCNVRILAATNQPLQRLVKEGRFREDLYHRINVVQVHVPPLRERRSDISPLTHHFIEAIGSQMGKSVTGITHEALQRLESYSWPGNVRELKNVIEHALLFCREDVVDVRHLREEIQGLTVSPGMNAPQKHGEQGIDKSPDYTVKPTNEWDREYLIETLNRERWNKRKTATALGVSPQTLYKYLKRFSIE